MASNNNVKPWDKPWSMEEIIDHADSWNLAGDAALLSTVTNLANNLLSKTIKLNDNVEGLISELDEVSVKLDLAQNDFSSLRNTQFIESRVYEDDETLDSSESNKTEEKTISEEERDQRITNVVLRGLTMVDKFYEKVTVPVSDSEEEEGDSSYVLKPKDPYSNRPLPYVIGTEEWYKESHIGLEDSDMESESDKEPEVYSDSDSDISMNSGFSRTKNIKASDSSSELDFSSKLNPSRPQAHSTFNDSARNSNIFDSNSDEEANSVPIQAPIASKNFAEQLAEKLGNVVGHDENVPNEEINRKPIQKVEPKSGFGLFFDEPPPIDDFEDSLLPNNAQSGIFSGGTGLFDDLDNEDNDDLFGNIPKTAATNQKQTLNNNTSDNKSNLQSGNAVKNKGLFDSDEDDEDMFSVKKNVGGVKKDFLKPLEKTSMPLFDEEPPEIATTKPETTTISKPETDTKQQQPEVTKKKPVGGVQLFGNSNVMNDFLKKNRRQSSTEEEEENEEEKWSETEDKKEENEKVVNEEKKRNHNEESIKKEQNKTSLFSDDNDDVKSKEENIFENKKPNILKSKEATPKKISLFGDETEEEYKKKSPQKTSLFDDDLFENDLFSNITSKKFTSSLFDDEDDSENADIFSDNLVTKNNTTNPQKVDLFTDIPEEIKEEIVIPTEKEEKQKNPIIERQVIGAEKPHKKHISLFDDEPPSDEDIFKIEINSNISDNLKKSLLFNDDEDDFLFSNNPVLPIENSSSSNSLTNENTDNGIPDIEVEVATPQISTGEVQKIQKPNQKVSLFDNTPPDDDWDISDNVFNEQQHDQDAYAGQDYQPENSESTNSSSLFDNEPPALIVSQETLAAANETSGIVADYTATRSISLDQDSFNPYASSTRRLSSDIFNDQQSNDSFLVTKNKSEIPTMESIAETSSKEKLENGGETPKNKDIESVVDITPSGDVDDFNSSLEEEETPKATAKQQKNTTSSSENSENEKKTPTKPPTIKNNYEKRPQSATKKITDIKSEDKQSDKPAIPTPKSKISDSKDRLDRINNKLSVKPTSTIRSKSERDMNIAALKEKLQANSSRPPVVQMRDKTNSTSPGKLRHSLNIDVNKLLPGMGGPPKKKDRPKTEFFDEPDKALPTKSFNLTTSQSEMSIEKASVEILRSVTKDRPRIQVKRRPSSKRGREILRKSVADFNEEFQQAMMEETDPEVLKNTKKLLESSEEITNNSSTTTEVKKEAKKKANSSSSSSSSEEDNDEEIKDTKDSKDTKSSENKEDSFGSTGDDVFTETTKKIEDIFNKKFEDKQTADILTTKKETIAKSLENILSKRSEPTKPKSKEETSKKLEDIFAKKLELTKTKDKKEETSKKLEDIFSKKLESKKEESEKNNIFDEDSDDSDLFSSKSISKKSAKPKENFDDLFSSSPPKKIFTTVTKNEETTSTTTKASSKEEKSQKPKDDIFNSSSDSDESEKSKDEASKSKESKKKDIFDDENSDEDIFSDKKKKSLKTTGKSKSLFDDDDEDEDDLFGTSSSKNKGSTNKETKKVIKPTVKKLENKEAHDDPLSKLL